MAVGDPPGGLHDPVPARRPGDGRPDEQQVKVDGAFALLPTDSSSSPAAPSRCRQRTPSPCLTIQWHRRGHEGQDQRHGPAAGVEQRPVQGGDPGAPGSGQRQRRPDEGQGDLTWPTSTSRSSSTARAGRGPPTATSTSATSSARSCSRTRANGSTGPISAAACRGSSSRPNSDALQAATQFQVQTALQRWLAERHRGQRRDGDRARTASST